MRLDVAALACVLVARLHAASGDPYVRQTLASYGEPGDTDCVVGDWEPKTECDARTLTQVFQRSVTVAPGGDGEACPNVEETRSCKPVHCHVGAWTEWSACNAVGKKVRTREAEIDPLYGGRACPHLRDEVKCCAKDCWVTDWSDWVCDDYTGTKVRTRDVAKAPEGDGKQCPSLREHGVACDPVDCELAQTGAWTECDDYGKKYYNLDVDTNAKYGGTCERTTREESCTNCFVNSPEQETKPYDPCKPREGTTSWFKSRVLDIATQPENGGRSCPAEEDRVDEKVCDPMACERYTPDDEPEPYGECKPGDGTTTWYKSRKLGVKKAALYGGSCDKRTDEKLCDPVDCAVKTTAQETKAYGACAEKDSSGKWFKTRVRDVVTNPRYGGTACPAEVDRTDELLCDPVDCMLKSDAEETTNTYGTCIASGPTRLGKQRKTVGIKTAPQYGGKACPPPAARFVERKCNMDDYLEAVTVACESDAVITSGDLTIKIGSPWKAEYHDGRSTVKFNTMETYDATGAPGKLVFTGGNCDAGPPGTKRTLTVTVQCNSVGLSIGAPSKSGSCKYAVTMGFPTLEICATAA